MSVVNGAMRLIGRVMRGERPEDVVQEHDEDAWDQAVADEIDENFRTGKDRMLSAEESAKVIDRLKKKWGMS